MPSLHSRSSHQTPCGDDTAALRGGTRSSTRWQLGLQHVFRIRERRALTSAKRPPGGAQAEGQEEITFLEESDFYSPVEAYDLPGQEQSARNSKRILGVWAQSVLMLPNR